MRMKSRESYERNVDTVSLEQAVKNPFVVADIGPRPKPEDKFTAVDAELKYVEESLCINLR